MKESKLLIEGRKAYKHILNIYKLISMLFLHILDILLFGIGIIEKRRNPLGKVNPSIAEIIREKKMAATLVN